MKKDINESPLFWPARIKGQTLWVLDETLLPAREVYIKVTQPMQAVRVIREMKTRAFGQLLVVCYAFLMEIRRTKQFPPQKKMECFHALAVQLNASRPTFPFAEVTGMFLEWAQKDSRRPQMSAILEKKIKGYLAGVRQARLKRIEKLSRVMNDGDSILTHCNVSGELAMAARLARQKGKKIQVFATETRPYFQGARLTCWELKRVGIDVVLVADNAVAALMSDHLINKVVVGSDRNCANGDFANKVGTYQIAVLARVFGIPFYVLTQPSRQIRQGSDIPIEIRDENELLTFNGRRIFPKRVKGFYPGFDVVPHELVTKSLALEIG